MSIERIEIILEGKDGATPTLKKFSSTLEDTGKKAEKTKGKLTGLKDGFGSLQGAMMAAGIVTTAKVASELYMMGIEMQRSETALITMSGGADQAAAALDAVKVASGGALDRLSATQNATRLFSMGLANTAEEAGRLTDIAVTLGSTMGKGPHEAFEEFTLLLANQSILRLDTFGISGAKVRDRMNELAQEMPGVARETRFMAAVMEEADGKMLALGEAGYQATSSVDILKAQITDLKLEVAEFLATGLTPWLDILMMGGIGGALKQHHQDILATADSYEEYRAEMDLVTHQSRGTGQGIDLLNESQWGIEYSARMATEAEGGLTGAIGEVGGAAGEAAEQLSGLVVQAKELNAQSIGQQGLKALNTALQEGFITQEEYDQSSRRIMDTLLDMDDAQIDANFQMRELIQSFGEGEVSASDLVTDLQAVNHELRVMDGQKKISISVDYSQFGEGNLGPGFANGGSFIVPPGYPNDSYPMRVTSGERVTVDRTGDDNSRKVEIGQVVINRQMELKAFDNMMNQWAGN